MFVSATWGRLDFNRHQGATKQGKGILGTPDDAVGGMLTNSGGYYLFNGLEAGEYLVVLPASNFAGGAALNGYWSSGFTSSRTLAPYHVDAVQV